MPIRPSEKARYPKNWKDISLRIRERAEDRCECVDECRLHPWGRCVEKQGRKALFAKGNIILTVAHLVSATRLPVRLDVTRYTEANEIVDMVGDLVIPDSETLKRFHMMHNRALSNFISSFSAGSTRFVIALPRIPPRSSPCRTIVSDSTASPVWIVLSRAGFADYYKPRKAALVATEMTPFSQEEARHFVFNSATFASSQSKAAFAFTHKFIATGRRTGFDVVRSLLRRDGEYFGTDRTLLDASTSTRTGHSVLYHIDYMPENCADDNLKAMCQRCHLRYDREHHAETARATRKAKSLQGEFL